ncbi:uncharacterized protein MELLADRAFT_76387 [Melampsora larici-populina 98AG31]|uniref:RlpA-like protein double-psi beta-barrel domain-containing protein n=1 Tax=Melampsora larici-populina (strain 98AG31 / pathotype 3-4-7) TaxID=747676 RepID=F4R4R0_MELLP|nr:uncharacterized protein MELLADRAFT_76387 [Melampsora larici-populina 98AG31]EGG12955.1 hypothetical protein MELLADRAFT_76387 [Melampsora larici-populina 98AG31]
MVMSILTLVPFIWIAALTLPSEARTLPTSVKLHRRFTFVAHAPPQDWSTDSLEDYDQYHFRFLSIGCHQKKTIDDKFFEACCHPRMKSDDLSKIPVQCHLSPQSMLAAHNYILKSTNYRGEISSGVGTPVYVTNGTVEPMKPTENRSASEPPTPDQLKDLLQAQKKVQILNEQYKSQGNGTSSALAAPVVTDHSTQDMSSSENSSSQDMSPSDNSSSKMATAPTVSKALLKDATNVPISNLTSQTEKATDAVAKQVSDDAAAQKAAAEAAAKKLADDAASQQAAAAAAAQKAASDAAAKKAADDAATASKQKSDDASTKKSSDDSASTQHDASSAGSLSGVSQVFGSDGDAKGTYFYQEGAAGACGNVNSDNTPLVALPTDMYAEGKHCGKQVMIKNTANGKTVIAKVQDMCPGCPSSTSLDLSTGAYDALGSQATGVLPIQWGFVQS